MELLMQVRPKLPVELVTVKLGCAKAVRCTRSRTGRRWNNLFFKSFYLRKQAGILFFQKLNCFFSFKALDLQVVYAGFQRADVYRLFQVCFRVQVNKLT